jgi:hypothetical protein
VVAYTLGDASTQTCQQLYNKLPDSYRQCKSYRDVWVRGGKSASTHGLSILRISHLESVQKSLSPKPALKPWVKKQVKSIMSNAGTILYDSAWLALSLKPYPSPSR